jgi:two-component system, NtrC family, sensor histidine kinase HydH
MKRFNKIYLIPISLGIILFSIISIWLFCEMVMFGNRTMRIINQEGQITSKAIKGIIQSQMYAGRISKGRLEYILSNIIDKTILRYVCIKKGKDIIYESGKGLHHTEIEQLSRLNRSKDKIFYFTTKMKLETPPPPPLKSKLWMSLPETVKKRIKEEEIIVRIKEKHTFKEHPEAFIDFRKSRQTVIIGIDISMFDQQLRSELNKTLILYILACVAIIVFILAWVYMIKNSKLRLKYAGVKAKTDKLEELSLAATGLAHEIKNPLGIIRGLSQEIAKNCKNKKLVEEIAVKIIDEADITTERLSDFMNYAKHITPNLETLNIKKYIEELLDILKYEFSEKEILIITNVEDFNIRTDHEFLNQIVINILMNSLNACKVNDTVKIESFIKNDKGTIEIADNGPGINSELLIDIFKPYISGNPKGHGIGLAIVKKLIEELEWNIDIESTPGTGTKTIISNIKIV